MIRAKFEGLDQVAKALRALGDEFSASVLISATSAACTPILNQARFNVYVVGIAKRTGTLDRAFYKMRIRQQSNAQQCTYIIGVHMGKRWQALTRFGTRQGAGTGRDAFYWWWLEFGKKGRTGTPFLGPALPTRKTDAVEAFRYRSREGIDKIVKKYGGKGID